VIKNLEVPPLRRFKAGRKRKAVNAKRIPHHRVHMARWADSVSGSGGSLPNNKTVVATSLRAKST
jgi:hypothetical protein